MNKYVALIGWLILSGTIVAQSFQIRTAVDQTDRALQVARDWKQTAEDTIKVAQDWKQIGLGSTNDYIVCRSMLTPRQRGDK